jgi:addiction module HigA family antidote
LSANKLALALRVPSGRVTSILNGKRAISAETALRLARHFGVSAQFWMNLQSRYDIEATSDQLAGRLEHEVQPRVA